MQVHKNRHREDSADRSLIVLSRHFLAHTETFSRVDDTYLHNGRPVGPPTVYVPGWLRRVCTADQPELAKSIERVLLSHQCPVELEFKPHDVTGVKEVRAVLRSQGKVVGRSTVYRETERPDWFRTSICVVCHTWSKP